MRSTLKFTWVEAKLFLREPLTVTFAFAFPLFVLFILANVFGNEPEIPGETMPADEADPWRGVGPTDFYVPAYVALVVASIGVVSIPVQFATYRERGIFRRYRASSISPWTLFGAHLVVMLAMASIGAVTIGIAASIVYGTGPPDAPMLTLAAFMLTVLAFAGLGLLLGALLPTARAAQAAGIIIFFVMMFISGAGPPRDVIGEPVRSLGETVPLTHAVLLLQDAWLGYGWNPAASLIVGAIAVVSTVLGIRFFRWS
jgi:ABC-2 type transport system permease protein